MIKKILLTLGIFGFLLIGNYSNAYTTLCDSSWSIRSRVIGSIGSYNYDSYSFGGLEYGNFLSEYAGIQKNLIAMGSNMLIWWENTGLPYVYYGDGYQGNPNTYLTCDEITFIGRDTIYNCSCSNYTNEEIKNFMSVIDSGDYYGYWQNDGMLFCFSSHVLHKTLCFGAMVYDSNGFPINSKGYSSLTFSDIDSNLLFNSPGVSGNGGSSDSFNGNVELSNDDIVSYYEDSRGFNYNMCFVGTWDFTQSEGTFKQGNGDNIFSYFNWFYNLGTGDNATGYKLSDVGKFIDEMYGNYDIYFNYGNRLSNGDIAYIYKFDINTHILDWVDTGFNNPFDEYTYVYTFYPKTLHYYTDYWRLYYYGGDLANYCYYKLNFNNSPQEDIYGNLENDISQAVLYNVGDWKVVNTNLKPSQSGNIVSVSEDWSGSPLDYFAVENGSGYEDFDAGTFFSDSFNRFKGVFGELDPGDFGFGYLPGYIITFMLALILFRFLSH